MQEGKEMSSREQMSPVNRGFHLGRIPLLLSIASLLICLAAPLSGQSLGRMWAARTGADQISVAWDSIPGATEYRIYAGAPDGASERPPVTKFSASSRSAVLMGL